MDSLVSTEWLAQHLGEPDLVVVDASWHMAASGRRGHDEYLAAHIPGARFLDIDAVSDSANPARSIGPALFSGSVAIGQLWLYIIAPLVGGAIAGVVAKTGLFEKD
jgi:thiosulfate/3-mercaptopyruvate sulfurtransferase